MIDLKYLTELFERERNENSEFREEMREKFSTFEKWVAVHDAIDTHRSTKTKQWFVLIGLLFTAVQTAVTFLK